MEPCASDQLARSASFPYVIIKPPSCELKLPAGMCLKAYSNSNSVDSLLTFLTL